MMHPERMERVSIIAPKSYLRNSVEKLYELGVCHIESHEKTDDVDICSPLPEGESISEMLISVRAMTSTLALAKKSSKHLPDSLSENAWEKMVTLVSSLHKEVLVQTSAIKTAQASLSDVEQKEKLIDNLHRLKLDPAILGPSEHLGRFIGSIENVSELKEGLKKITRRYELLSAQGDKGRNLVALYVDQAFANDASIELAKQGFVEIDVGPIDLKKGFDAQRKLLASTRKKQEETLNKANKKLSGIKKEHGSYIASIQIMLERESRKAQVPLQFGGTKEAFTLTGWVPASKKNRLEKELNEICKGKVAISFKKAGHQDSPPIKLNNKAPINSFESLLTLYELPKYDEFDPTTLMFITFPLFFAFMLGDVGYGIITFIIFATLYKKLSVGKALLKVMMIASLVTILFGFGFGEYLGFEHVSVETGEKWCDTVGLCLPVHEIGSGAHTKVVADFPRLFNRTHAMFVIGGQSLLAVLVIGVIIGFIHLNFGLLLGFLNELHHGVWTAFTHKISWMVMEVGVITLALSYAGAIGLANWIGWVVFAIGLALILKGEGMIGLIELPAIWSNMLSYVRLGAVGLASVGLAVVVNENLAMPFFEKGGIYIAVAILIMICGHTINIALGIIGPFLHSVRLHYVEFFGKFFHGGGRPFRPFGQEE